MFLKLIPVALSLLTLPLAAQDSKSDAAKPQNELELKVSAMDAAIGGALWVKAEPKKF